ncbi:MAG TPA: 3-hydroxyacyl-CoA dehydrogenase [Hyphomicrobiaceae bacterium]|nr:3-hydroxyacyl-CoA dehydrogenase [Hyphomicrobiaceae bacterium]
MPFDPKAKDLVIGVVGTGTMGRGIVQVSAQGGMNVIAYDEKPGAAEAARDFIAKLLMSQVEKGRLPEADAKAALGRITVASSLDDLAKANCVVEAIIERLDAKQEMFARLDALCGPDTILATNTSSLLVSAIANRCKHPERVGGMHFFNPVPLMKLVEVIPGLKTADWVTDAMMTIGRRMTREPILCKDSPSFLVNHVGRGMGPECQRILLENIGTAADIDRIMTGAPGFRMGPFTLADLVGIDIGIASQESAFAQFYGEPAFAPSPLTAVRAAGNLLGQKTGQGWYAYGKDGKKVEPPMLATPAARPKSVWVHPSKSHQDLIDPLIAIFRASGATIESGEKPSDTALTVICPIGYDVTTACCDLKYDPRRTVAVNVLFGLKGPRELMVTPAIDPAYREAAHGLVGSDGQPVIVINDSPGFVSQRAVAGMINVCCGIAQRGIGTPADIDKGAKLGLGYPFGPIEWGQSIGPGRVLFILERLEAFYKEPRYKPSPWLKRRVMLGLPLATPEGKMA